jgi:hypothetical protein
MTLRIKLSHLVAGVVVGALLVGAGYALATTRNSVIHACVNARTRALTVPAKGRCARGSKALNWNQRGPKGKRGARGARGSAGAAGATGSPATVSIGSVSTEPAGSRATVSNSGTASNAILNFGIPQGAAGANATGAAATAYGEVWMGSGVNSAKFADGSNHANVEGVGGGNGTAVVGITGCSSSGLVEPVIAVTANHDPNDGLAGSNSAGVAAAYVTGWSVSGSTLTFGVSTYSGAGATAADSDFSFSVYC